MATSNTLETERLLLRPFRLTDAGAVQAVLGDSRVVATLLDFPQPFEQADAELWIRLQEAAWKRGERFSFALVLKATKHLIGGADVELQSEHNRGDIAYWLEPGCWGQGLATEAAGRMLRYGFDTLGLHRVYAQCMSTNLASARVMEKIGLKYEATLRQHCLKDGRWIDMVVYGMLNVES